jgi:hypothetical protein
VLIGVAAWHTGILKWLCLGLFILLLMGTVATFVSEVAGLRRSRRQAKRPVIHHPVFGPVVRDQWDTGLLTFREFPHVRVFWHPNREETVGQLSAEHRQWVTNRSRYVAELSSVCRNFGVRAALQSLGVYEATIAVPKRGEPTAAQYGSKSSGVCWPMRSLDGVHPHTDKAIQITAMRFKSSTNGAEVRWRAT